MIDFDLARTIVNVSFSPTGEALRLVLLDSLDSPKGQAILEQKYAVARSELGPDASEFEVMTEAVLLLDTTLQIQAFGGEW